MHRAFITTINKTMINILIVILSKYFTIGTFRKFIYTKDKLKNKKPTHTTNDRVRGAFGSEIIQLQLAAL